jgi:alkylation response protein AidB-like acyl-CoA dehydrogenase
MATQTQLGPAGEPDLQWVLLPAASCQIIDTWHAAGLRGTGSHDFQVDDVFVPSEHCIPLFAFFAGPQMQTAAAYRTPFHDMQCPMVAGVALGIARAAIDSFTLLAAPKTPAIGTMTRADQHTTHLRVGRAEALLRAARAYRYGTLAEVTAAHQAGCPAGPDDAAALRLAAVYSAQNAIEAVGLAFDAGGGTSIYESNQLERHFRDVHMVTHHMLAGPGNIEMVGQFLLGRRLMPRR